MNDLEKLMAKARDSVDLYITAATMLSGMEDTGSESEIMQMRTQLGCAAMDVAKAMVNIDLKINCGGCVDRAIELGSAAG